MVIILIYLLQKKLQIDKNNNKKMKLQKHTNTFWNERASRPLTNTYRYQLKASNRYT